MSETNQILLSIVLLIAVFILTRWGMARQMQRAARRVIQDLQERGAYDPDTAVELPYAKKNWLNFGLRDYRPKAIEALVVGGVVILTQDGRYYLPARDDSDGYNIGQNTSFPDKY